MSSQPAPSPDTLPPRGLQPGPAALGDAEHPLVRMPFTAQVDGRQYMGDGVSLVEAQVIGLADPALENQERLVRIAFDFGGFAVSIHPQARILRDGPQRLVLRFAEPTGSHLPQLRHLLNDYISGDLVSFGSVIRAGSLAGPAAGGRGGVAGGGTGLWLRRLAGGTATFVLTTALVALAGLLVTERLLVSSLDGAGRVVLDGQALAATADGQLSYLDPDAAEGEVVFALATTGGDTLSVVKPCDCEAIPAGVALGGTVLAGDPVVTLVRGTPDLVIEATVTPHELFLIQDAGGAELRLPGGGTGFASLAAPPPPVASGEAVTVRLRPTDPLGAERAGEAVELRVRRQPDSILDLLARRWDSLSSAWAPAAAS